MPAKTVKITLNLDAAVKQKIEELIQQKVIKNQTHFINSCLIKSLKDREKIASLQRLKQKLHCLKSYKSEVSIIDARDQVRVESLDRS